MYFLFHPQTPFIHVLHFEIASPRPIRTDTANDSLTQGAVVGCRNAHQRFPARDGGVHTVSVPWLTRSSRYCAMIRLKQLPK